MIHVNTNSQIKLKTSMLGSSLCDYSDSYVLVGGTITITGTVDDDAAKQLDERNKGVMTVCSYHVTYAFQSESTLYSCLNVKELLSRNRREI